MLRLLLPLILLMPSSLLAQSVVVKDAWIRGTVGAQQATGAFMLITSKVPARLVAASSPVAKVVEIHGMKLERDVMRMFPVEAVELPAGQTVKLAPGGYHVMFTGLTRTLKAGERVPLRLTVEVAGGGKEAVELLVEVRDVTGAAAQHRHGH